MKIAIFVSGSGTNMENLIKHIQSGKLDCHAAVVICDNPKAAAIEKANISNIPVSLFDRKKYESKADFEKAIIAELDKKEIDLIVLAGFMRILSEAFVNHFWGRIINIHPSLLPKFPGAHGIKDAFEAKEKETGATVHFVVPEVDSGPVILQKRCGIDSEDTLESLEEKVHAIEYEIYPAALQKVLDGQVKPPVKQ